MVYTFRCLTFQHTPSSHKTERGSFITRLSGEKKVKGLTMYSKLHGEVTATDFVLHI